VESNVLEGVISSNIFKLMMDMLWMTGGFEPDLDIGTDIGMDDTKGARKPITDHEFDELRNR